MRAEMVEGKGGREKIAALPRRPTTARAKQMKKEKMVKLEIHKRKFQFPTNGFSFEFYSFAFLSIIMVWSHSKRNKIKGINPTMAKVDIERVI